MRPSNQIRSSTLVVHLCSQSLGDVWPGHKQLLRGHDCNSALPARVPRETIAPDRVVIPTEARCSGPTHLRGETQVSKRNLGNPLKVWGLQLHFPQSEAYSCLHPGLHSGGVLRPCKAPVTVLGLYQSSPRFTACVNPNHRHARSIGSENDEVSPRVQTLYRIR